MSSVCVCVWQVRTNHERLVRLASEEEKDYPLMLQTTSQWTEKGLLLLISFPSPFSFILLPPLFPLPAYFFLSSLPTELSRD